MLRDRFREISEQAAKERAKKEAIDKRRREEAPLVLSIQEQLQREEEAKKRRAAAEVKAGPVRAQIAELEKQKQDLERLHLELAEGYKEASEALAEFKTVNREIETAYQTHKEDLASHLGIKEKAEVVKHPEFQEEEDVKSYKEKGKKTRAAVQRVRADKQAAKQALREERPDLSFRSNVREQAFAAIAGKISEIESAIAQLKEQLPEQQELQEKRQEELPKLEARHSKENARFDPYDLTDYHHNRRLVLEADADLAPQLGEGWVKGSIKNHYAKVVDGKVAEKMRKQGLDQAEHDLRRLDNLDQEITEAENAIAAMTEAKNRLRAVLEQAFDDKEISAGFMNSYLTKTGYNARDLAEHCVTVLLPRRMERSNFKSLGDYYYNLSEENHRNLLERQRRELDIMRSRGGIQYSQIINPQHIIAGMKKAEAFLNELSAMISSNPKEVLKGLYLDDVKLDMTWPSVAEYKTIERHRKTTELLREEPIGGALKKVEEEKQLLQAEGEKVKAVVDARIDNEWSSAMLSRFTLEHSQCWELNKKQKEINEERQLAARTLEQLSSVREQFQNRLAEELTVKKQASDHARHSRYSNWELKSVPLESDIDEINQRLKRVRERRTTLVDEIHAKKQNKPGKLKGLLGAQEAYEKALRILQTQKEKADADYAVATQAIETKAKEQEQLAPLRTLTDTLNFGAEFADKGGLTVAQLLQRAEPYFQAAQERRLPAEEEQIVLTLAALQERAATAKKKFEEALPLLHAVKK